MQSAMCAARFIVGGDGKLEALLACTKALLKSRDCNTFDKDMCMNEATGGTSLQHATWGANLGQGVGLSVHVRYIWCYLDSRSGVFIIMPCWLYLHDSHTPSTSSVHIQLPLVRSDVFYRTKARTKVTSHNTGVHAMSCTASQGQASMSGAPLAGPADSPWDAVCDIGCVSICVYTLQVTALCATLASVLLDFSSRIS